MKKYTKKDLHIALGFASFFTILYFIVLSNIAFQYAVELSEVVKILSWLGCLALPILLLISWYMCLERFVSLELSLDSEGSGKWRRLFLAIRIVMMLGLGILVFQRTMELVVFVGDHFRYMEKLFVCIIIKACIVIGWWGACIYGVRIQKQIISGKCWKRYLVILFVWIFILFGISHCTLPYEEEQVSKAWIEYMKEQD